MRVSTLQYFQGNIGKLNALQSQQVTLQKQISSGVAVEKPSDDPARLFEGIQAQRGMDRAEQFNRNILFARTQLEQFDTALAQSTDILVDVKSRLLAATGSLVNDSDRKTYAVELQGLRDALLGVANKQDLSGRFLFAGNSESVQPINANFEYAAQRPTGNEPAGLTVQVGEGVYVNLGLTARDAFVLQDADPASTPPTGEVNVFSLLNEAIDSLNNGASADEIRGYSAGLNAVFDQVQNSRAGLGVRLASLDANEALNRSDKTNFAQLKSSAVDTDMAKAISEMVQGQNQVQAFQLSYSNIAKLSLFNFIA